MILASASRAVQLPTASGGEGFTPPGPEIFWLPIIGDGEWAITEQMIWGGVSVVLISVALVMLTRNVSIVPSKSQFLFEGFYNFARNGIARDMIGTKHFLKFVPLLFSIFTLILVNNWFGVLPPVMNPTFGRIGFPIAATIVVYVVYHWVGIKRYGLGGYFAHMIPEGLPGWIKPVIFPLELITYFITRPLTLALRLFGNMFAGHMLLVVFIVGGWYLFKTFDPGLMAVAVPAWILGFALTIFEALIQFLQAYVFTLLAASYIGGALVDEH